MEGLKKITNEQYFADNQYINSSVLKELSKTCPKIAYEYYAGVRSLSSKALSFGTLVHLHMFELDEFCKLPVFDGAVRRGQKWEEFRQAHQDKIIYTEKEIEEARAVSKALQYGKAKRYFEGRGESEYSAFWIDSETQVKCKAKYDRITKIDDVITIVDLKTTSNIEHFHFSFFKYLYHISAIHYLSGLETILKKPCQIIYVAVSTKEPHDIRVFKLNDESVLALTPDYIKLLKTWKECIDNNSFPDYPEIEELNAPYYLLRSSESNEFEIDLF
jgi:hypothetical protein